MLGDNVGIKQSSYAASYSASTVRFSLWTARPDESTILPTTFDHGHQIHCACSHKTPRYHLRRAEVHLKDTTAARIVSDAASA